MKRDARIDIIKITIFRVIGKNSGSDHIENPVDDPGVQIDPELFLCIAQSKSGKNIIRYLCRSRQCDAGTCVKTDTIIK